MYLVLKKMICLSRPSRGLAEIHTSIESKEIALDEGEETENDNGASPEVKDV